MPNKLGCCCCYCHHHPRGLEAARQANVTRVAWEKYQSPVFLHLNPNLISKTLITPFCPVPSPSSGYVLLFHSLWSLLPSKCPFPGRTDRTLPQALEDQGLRIWITCSAGMWILHLGSSARSDSSEKTPTRVRTRLHKHRPKTGSWDFPGSPVVRTQLFLCCGPGSNPDQGTKILQAMGCREKKKSLHLVS